MVAFVGRPNVGKSTLFNTLTKSKVMAKDMLFATLDPTIRGCTLPSGMKIMLSDTVGFISNLPTELIAAFRATLEEVIDHYNTFFGLGLTDGEIHDLIEFLKSL